MTPLKEEDAYPADPEPGYGWEKLFAEQMYRSGSARCEFRNCSFSSSSVYGPLGIYEGGKEKAPAEISRKVALAWTIALTGVGTANGAPHSERGHVMGKTEPSYCDCSVAFLVPSIASRTCCVNPAA